MATPIAPRGSMADALVARLRQDIGDGTLAAGARLPTEQQLGAALGVSRTVVREAIAALRAEGLVIARQGSGMFVAAQDDRRPFRIDPEALASITNVLSLMELRTGLESEAAALAASRRTKADLEHLDRAMAAYAAADDETAADADFEFHRALVLATHNLYFEEFLRFLAQFIRPRQSIRTMAVSPGERAAYRARVQAEHQAVRDAIEAGDTEAARLAAQSHLQNSRSRFGKLREKLQHQSGSEPSA
jgi:GntR family transcriptional repressor for pyruvate dehydrogenase complex